MMTNGDRKGQIFLSHPHMNNVFYFLLTIKILHVHIFLKKGLPDVPEYAEMQHIMLTSLYHNNDITYLPTCGC